MTSGEWNNRAVVSMRADNCTLIRLINSWRIYLLWVHQLEIGILVECNHSHEKVVINSLIQTRTLHL